MERHQDKVFNGSGPPAQGLLKNPRGALYHLLQIVVHGAGNIEHKGQSRGAVSGPIIFLEPGDCQEPVRADTERQEQALQENTAHF